MSNETSEPTIPETAANPDPMPVEDGMPRAATEGGGAEGEERMDTGGDGSAAPEEEWERLRSRVAAAEEFKDRYLRTVADLENFRKRSARERTEAVQFANQGLLEKLVPALDNLDMALAAVTSAQGASVEGLKTGVEMVLSQVKGVLREAGMEEIDAAGQPFDPTWHQAVAEEETHTVPEGQVVRQLRKGYRLHQRLLRPATVVVSRPPQG